MPKYYEYRHVVGFEETNLVGTVHFVNLLRWQGRCWEMLLKDKELAALLKSELELKTLRAECEYFCEVNAFDELSVRMRLEELTGTEVELNFDYVRVDDDKLVARGRRRIDYLTRGPATVALRDALLPYAETPI